jgi:hypothetical protein
MPTAGAAVLLAAAAHGIGKHRRAAQIRFQNCIQAHASSASTTLLSVIRSFIHLTPTFVLL